MSLEHVPSKGAKRYRRAEASTYLKTNWGIDAAVRTLAKLACIGGGPVMEYVGRFPIYTEENLDAWATRKISPPVSNTTERQQQRRAA